MSYAEKLINCPSKESSCAAQTILQEFVSARSILNKNLISVKEAINRTFDWHITALESRATWLVSHAENIFQLKEVELSKKIKELEISYGGSHKCQESENYNNSKEKSHNARSIHRSEQMLLRLYDKIDVMSFTADDDILHNIIMGFGSIDISPCDFMRGEQLCDLHISNDQDLSVEENIISNHNLELDLKLMEASDINSKSQKMVKQSMEKFDGSPEPAEICGSLNFEKLSLGDADDSLLSWLRQPKLKSNIEPPEILEEKSSFQDNIEFPDKTDCSKYNSSAMENDEHIALSSWLKRSDVDHNEIQSSDNVSTVVAPNDKVFLNVVDHASGIMEASYIDCIKYNSHNNASSIQVCLDCSNDSSICNINRNQNFRSQESDYLLDRTTFTSENIDHLSKILDAPYSNFILARTVLEKLGSLKRKCPWGSPDNKAQYNNTLSVQEKRKPIT